MTSLFRLIPIDIVALSTIMNNPFQRLSGYLGLLGSVLAEGRSQFPHFKVFLI